MLSAQDSPMGVPRELLEAKKLELQQEQVRDIRGRTYRTYRALLTCGFSYRKLPPRLVVPKRMHKMP
jgi:hypothetical protein